MSILLHKNSQMQTLDQGISLDDFTLEKASIIRSYHKSFAEYTSTELISLPNFAKEMGLAHFMVKDESTRFGLKAFKVLGASHAMGRYLAKILKQPFENINSEYLCKKEIRAAMGDIVFTSTTDGNHGRGVAFTAKKLQQKAIIYMPSGTELGRKKNILDLGADCIITDLNYDQTVQMTFEKAKLEGHILIQDTAFDGYEEIPLWIKQGYLTLALEIFEQLQSMSVMPTHIFLQAGVGAFPACIVAFLHAVYGSNAPKCIIMEPHSAPCFYISAVANDGNAHTVEGDLTSLMAGLACGKPCVQSWPIIRDYVFAFVSAPDYIAANGMRILAAPLMGDRPIISGESGACTTGLVHWLMTHNEAKQYRETLELNTNSSVLCISTEGDTVPQIYKNVVWQGAFADEDNQMHREL